MVLSQTIEPFWGIPKPQSQLKNTPSREKGENLMSENYNRFRKRQIHIMATDAEYTMLKDRMKRCHVNSMNEYLLRMGIDGCILVIDDNQALNDLIYEINKIGTNINQIAHVANSNGYVSDANIKLTQEMLYNPFQHQRSLLLSQLEGKT